MCENYELLIQNISKSIGRERLSKILSQPNCDIDGSFLGFLDVYAGVASKLPKSMTILDIGCAYAIQADYFSDYRKYIGVDVELRQHLEQENAVFYQETGEEFLTKIQMDFYYHDLRQLDTFVICSWVSARNEFLPKLIKILFPYYYIAYVDGSVDKNFPPTRNREKSR